MSSKPTANGTYFMVESGSWVPPVYFRAALGNLTIILLDRGNKTPLFKEPGKIHNRFTKKRFNYPGKN
jgi:hypothetical protein